jgi:hypothetical protein
MQRWEYRVVSLRDGTYTTTLNDYGREGWELVSVVSQPPESPAPSQEGGMPMPRALGRLEAAAGKLNRLGASDSTEDQAAAPSALLWVLRRPLPDRADDPYDIEPHS